MDNTSSSTYSNEQPQDQQAESEYIPPPSFVSEPVCAQCGSKEFTEDHHSGDMICTSCGTICQERSITHDAEYRIFSEDSSSANKIRVGQTYNPLMEYSLTEKTHLERDEKEFLWDGMRNIDEIFFKLYKGDSMNTPSQSRAKELFQQAFRIQVLQKKGSVPMKRSGEKKSKNRQKFSRRKQFVVACIAQALKENGIETWDTKDLSDQLDGINVSNYSVRNCLKDLNM